MKNFIYTTLGLPRELRARLDEYNREHNLGDNLSAEVIRRLELSFELDAQLEKLEKVLHAIDFSARPADVMDAAVGREEPEPRVTKYIVVGRLPCGERTFLDTPEDAVAHAQTLMRRSFTPGKGEPFLVAEVLTVVERAKPVPPPPPPLVVRSPKASDFAK